MRKSPLYGYLCFGFILLLFALTACRSTQVGPSLAGLTAGDAVEGTDTTFSWTASDPNGDTLQCTIDPGDGSNSLQIEDCGQNSSAIHTYAATGIYTATLQVSDGNRQDTATVEVPVGEAEVDLFPTPVHETTSEFPTIDDDFLEVAFLPDFSFPFYGSNYSSVYLNTNGGLTFGGGDANYDVAASEVTLPAIAVFWGDMDAGQYASSTSRASQMSYQRFPNRFIVRYNQFQDNDDETWNNTATLTLWSNGNIEIDYGEVISEDIMVGVFDGTHADDRNQSVAALFEDFASTGTGIILFDYAADSVPHTGELDNETILFTP